MIDVAAVQVSSDKYQEYQDLTTHIRYGVNLHPIWFNSYIDEFGYANKNYILEAREHSSGVLCGFLPLVQKDSRESRFVTQRRFVPAGYGPTDFFGLPCLPTFEAQVVSAFAKWFKENSSRWDQLTINLVPFESSSWQLFVNALQQVGLEAEVISDRNYLKLDVTRPYGEYLEQLGADKVKEMRYYWNKLRKISSIVYVQYIEHNLSDYFNDFIMMYSSRRISKAQSDPYTRVPQLYSFMKKIIPEYEKRNWIRLARLVVGDSAIAYCYHFVYQQVVYYHMPAFLEEYRSYSPGRILLMELIKGAFEDESIQEFNFMRSEYGYKLWFAPEPKPYVSIKVENPWSSRNKLLSAFTLIRDWKKKIGGTTRPANPSSEVRR